MKLSTLRWMLGSLFLGVFAGAVNTASAQPLYWQPWAPIVTGPGFINPPPHIIIGGWWNSPDYGRSDIRICRLSDNLGRWSYGSFHGGTCHYYSHSLRRGHSVGIGFDLLGGEPQPLWISGNHRHRTLWVNPEGNPALGGQQQTITAQKEELESLCRIVQGDGIYVGTLIDDSCYASWQGLELISADYEVIDLGDER